MDVCFKSVNIPLLKKEGFNCVDMHIHTVASDAIITPVQAIKKASKLGCGISITDHNKISSCLEAAKNKKNVIVIPGIEINTAQKKDVLIYFYSVSELKEFYGKYVEPKLPRIFQTSKINFVDLLDITRDYNCVICAAHPCASLHKNLKNFAENKDIAEIISKIPLFEVLNSNLFRQNNIDAMEWAMKENKSFSGGSDAHTLEGIGSCITCSPADNVDDFLDSILRKQNKVIGTETNRWDKFKAVLAIIQRNIGTLDNLVK